MSFLSRTRPSAALLPLSMLIACSSAPASRSGPDVSSEAPTIRYVEDASGQGAFELAGLTDSDLKTLPAEDDREGWRRVFAVHLDLEDKASGEPLPPVLGSYLLKDRSVRFIPRYPLSKGTTYRACFFPVEPLASGALTPIETIIEIEKPHREPRTLVEQVYPSSEELPENLLKFYVHFSAPMSQGNAYEHLRLCDERGSEIPSPFLEVREELWTPDSRRLTLFIHPGRIKRGLHLRDEMGPVLIEGGTYTLSIARSFLDADGLPLLEEHRKTFRVVGPDFVQPDPASWTISSPAAGSLDALAVALGQPMDHALLHSMIRVVDPAGEELEGEIAIDLGETIFKFRPANAWRAGEHRLVVDSRLEDQTGNNLTALFDVDVFERTDPQDVPEQIQIPFAIQ